MDEMVERKKLTHWYQTALFSSHVIHHTPRKPARMSSSTMADKASDIKQLENQIWLTKKSIVLAEAQLKE